MTVAWEWNTLASGHNHSLKMIFSFFIFKKDMKKIFEKYKAEIVLAAVVVGVVVIYNVNKSKTATITAVPPTPPSVTPMS